VTGLLRQAGRTVGLVIAWIAARVNTPLLVVVVVAVVIVVGLVCWVLSDGERSDRVAQIIVAWRGDARCLTGNARGGKGMTSARHRR
jgi:hypothetical protein